MMGELPDYHFFQVAKCIRKGTLVPFLGSGVNLCDRGERDQFEARHVLPNGAELAGYLAREWDYPADELVELSRVSQYVAVMAGEQELYTTLHELFDVDYNPTLLHHFLAAVPATLRDQGCPQHQLIVTTNYDDALERALREANEEFDVVSYISDGPNRGKCRHTLPDGSSRIVERPNEYGDVSTDKRTVIVKIHGAVDRAEQDLDSYVITEDHYIDYLTNSDIAGLFPVHVAAKLNQPSTHFLFLGYGLRDWNLRVFLRRIWNTDERRDNRSWAVQYPVNDIDEHAWQQRGKVEILPVPLRDYLARLQAALSEPPHPNVSP